MMMMMMMTVVMIATMRMPHPVILVTKILMGAQTVERI